MELLSLGCIIRLVRDPTPLVVASLLWANSSVLAQVPQVPFSAIPSGYGLPTGMTVAPGQVLRLFVQGVGANLTQPVFATSLPLPTTLAGISIRFQENGSGAGATPTLLPLFAVAPFSACSGTVYDILNFEFSPPTPYPCGSIAAITLQIPFEATYSGLGEPENAAVGVGLTIFEGGTAKASVAMNIFQDQIHVISACDMPVTTAYSYSGDTPSPSPRCPGVAFHGDGTQVTSLKPAQKGEYLVMYALGLGVTTPQAVTGQASPPNASVPIRLGFDFNPNEAPQQAYGAQTTQDLIFAGLVAGSVGLYQVDFMVPDPPPGTLPCGYNNVTNVRTGSNLTVSITGQASYDGAAICVAINQPPASKN